MEAVESSRGRINWAHLCLGEMVARGYVHTVLTTNFDQLALDGIIRAGIIPVVADGIEALARVSGRPGHPKSCIYTAPCTPITRVTAARPCAKPDESRHAAGDIRLVERQHAAGRGGISWQRRRRDVLAHKSGERPPGQGDLLDRTQPGPGCAVAASQGATGTRAPQVPDSRPGRGPVLRRHHARAQPRHPFLDARPRRFADRRRRSHRRTFG